MSSRQREQREVRMKTAQDLAEQTRGFDATAVKLPDNAEWFAVSKLKDGDTPIVDFMPYIVGPGNPDCDEGWGYYRRKYLVHRLPTPKMPRGMPFCCEWNFGRKCRICRWLEKVANADLAKDCKAKTRYLWIVNDKPGVTPGEKENPWKIFDSNDYNKGMGFRELMQDAINASDGGQEFCDLKKGSSVRLTVRQQPGFGGDSKPYNAVTRIDFKVRKHSYSSKLLAAAPCLDAMLIDTPDEQIEELIGEGQQEEQPKQERSRSKPAEPDSAIDSGLEPEERSDVDSKVDASGSDVDSDVGSDPEPDSAIEPPAKSKASKNSKPAKFSKGDYVTYKKEEWEVLKVSGDGTSLTLEDSDGTQIHASPAECKKVPVADASQDSAIDSDLKPEDSAVEPPVKGKAKAAVDSDIDSEVEPEDSAVDSDVEPPAKKPSKPAAKKPAVKAPVKPAAKKRK